jgi:uncharacterized protein (TIGR02271 family)
MAQDDRNVVSLDEGYEVAEGEPDVRGWDVYTTDQHKIGDVEDLLVDPARMKVRYLLVELDGERAASDGDRTIRVPIERARLEQREKHVFIDSSEANLRSFGSVPADRWSDEHQRMTTAAEELRIGKRQASQGSVTIGKHVETEHVRQPVTVRREEVEVERRPVANRPATDADMRAQEIQVPVTGEEVVVEKRPVVKEEVIVSKHPVEEQRTIEEEVRRERIDVERHGDVRSRESTKDR